VTDQGPDTRDLPAAEGEREEFTAEIPSLFRIAIAPTIWAAHFLASYVAAAIYCARYATEMQAILPFRVVVLALGAVALAGIAWTGVAAFRQWNVDAQRDAREVAIDLVEEEEGRHEFLGHAALLLSVISFIGVVYTALPVLVIPSCI
jgi:hypothetical protein